MQLGQAAAEVDEEARPAAAPGDGLHGQEGLAAGLSGDGTAWHSQHSDGGERRQALGLALEHLVGCVTVGLDESAARRSTARPTRRR